MEELDRLRNKRYVIRSITGDLLEKIKNVLPETELEILDEMNAQLSEKEQLLSELDKNIEEKIITQDDLKNEIMDVQRFREKIVGAKARLSRLQRQQLRSGTAETPGMSRLSLENPSEISSKSVRLPKLNMEKYDGDILKWQEWWTQFESSFHKSSHIGKTEKFCYLKTLLTGTAANSIAGMSLTEDNYDQAVKILKDRFGKNEMVVSAHINKLLELTPVKEISDYGKLRKLYDTCNIQVRNLESAGVKLDSYGGLLFPLLTKLLPEEIVLEFNRKNESKGSWNAAELLEFLGKEIENRERTSILRQYSSSRSEASSRSSVEYSTTSRKANSKQFSTAALGTIVRIPCAFCNSCDHTSKDCNITSITERKNALKKRGRCFVCLKERHIAKFCRSKVTCSRCQRRHNVLICEKEQAEEKVTPEESNKLGANSGTVISSVSENHTNKGVVLLQTATVIAEGNQQRATVRCLIDGGSQRSFIREDLSKHLGLQVLGKESLVIHTFGSNQPERMEARRIKLKLKNFWNPEINLDIEALESPTLCSANIQVPGKHIQNRLKEDGLILADDIISGECVPAVTILLGSDYYWKVVTGNTRRLSESLMAIETIFGWIVHGPTNVLTITTGPETHMMKIITQEQGDPEKQRLNDILQKFWELEAIGVTDCPKPFDSEADPVLEKFNATLTQKDGRYSVRLPWKDEHEPLKDNKDVALRRFDALVRKFRKQPEFYNRYNEVIQSHVDRGIVEKATDEHITCDEKVFYLPHSAVIREDKSTTKLRVVFDASSHANEAPSLNDCLHAGPNLNPDLLSLLVEFRLHPIAFTADVEQAFLQIALHEKDRNATRFFWIDGPLKPEGEMNVQVLRMTRVLFGVTSSPFLLAATIKGHIKRHEAKFPEACKILDRYLYVDDLISGASSVEEALRLSTEVKKVLEDAQMNLRKWQSNSKDLKQKWFDSKEPKFELDVDSKNKQLNHCKVLGILWRPETDELNFDVSNVLHFISKCQNTKRNILHVAGRIFDPLGFLIPYTIRVKVIFQELWKRKVGWDEDLPQDVQKEWNQWCDELQLLEDIAIPRYYLSQATEKVGREIQLHCFTDASPTAYGAVLYLRCLESNGRVNTTLIMSKARVAPIRKISLPRLELMGALIGARLAAYILPPFQKIYSATVRFWTDSTIVLSWIDSEPQRWKTFVQNRVREIQEKAQPHSWSFCPGNLNPADLLTRGIAARRFVDQHLWWYGPDFLGQSCEYWPDGKLSELPSGIIQDEARAVMSNVVQENTLNILEIDNYSSLARLIRVTSWVMRFIHNAKNKINREHGPLTIGEMNRAQKYWIKVSQKNSFDQEIADLLKIGRISRNSRILAFEPFLDEDNILRMKGRLQESTLTFDQKHPVLLAGGDRFCELLVQQAHNAVGHAGVAETLTHVRDMFWILRGRQRTRKIIKRCNVCKKLSAKPANQMAAPLPAERISESPPFHTVGIDFAGPLILKNKDITEKSYILLISCAVTRAVHLELVPDMTVDSFLQAFKRFVGRRGVCATIFSDNAKTFKRASRELAELWKSLRHEDVINYFNEHRIVWKFIVERAPWWGGFWERMVRSVKIFLRRILGKALLNAWEMTTVLVEIEAIINSRPLTYTYSDPNEPEVLTPAHFLIGRRLLSLPSAPDSPNTPVSNRDELTKRLKNRQILLDNFWRQWQRSYMMDLRSFHQIPSTKATEKLREGMLVMLQEKSLPRMVWKMGLIEKTYPGRDGRVRVCKIRLPDRKIIKRPIQLICPFEVD